MSLDLALAARTAWRDTLGAEPDDAWAWDEAGGDSLAMLNLVYMLELRLGRTVPLDRMRPDMTLDELVEALAATPEPTAAGPRVFLLPGINGDGLSLAEFRRGLAGVLDIELVALPGIDAPAAVLRDMAATGAAVASFIDTAQPSGPLLLAGYSFGGSVALAAAAHLVASGRTVALVAGLDPVVGPAMLGRPYRLNRAQRWRQRARWVGTRLASWDSARRLGQAAFDRFLPRWAPGLRRKLLKWMRTEARERWLMAPTTTPVFVAASAEFAHAAVPIWQARCPALELLHVDATHMDIIRGNSLAVTSAAFERAVLAAAG